MSIGSIGIGIDFGPVRGIGIGLTKLVLSVSDTYILMLDFRAAVIPFFGRYTFYKK